MAVNVSPSSSTTRFSKAVTEACASVPAFFASAIARVVAPPTPRDALLAATSVLSVATSAS